MTDLNPATRQVVDDFDTQAKKRAAEVMAVIDQAPGELS